MAATPSRALLIPAHRLRSQSVARRFALTIGLAACVILLLLGTIGWVSYSSAVARHADEAAAVAKLMGREAERFMDSADLLLHQMTDVATATDRSDPAAVAALGANLERLRRTVPGAFRLFVFDPEGNVVASNVSDLQPGLNIRGRDYFQAHVERDAGLIVSRPLTALIDEVPIFVLSRRLSDAQGRFLGIVSVSVQPGAIAAFYHSLGFGPDTSFTWLRSDGQRLLEEPPIPGDRLLDAPIPAEFIHSVARAPVAGSYRFQADSDATEREVWYQRIGRYPLYVALGWKPEAVAIAWLGGVLPYGFAAGAILLTLAGAAAYALRWARMEDLYLHRLNEALDQKEILLREVDHRVKNSLQLVCSLLQIQIGKTTDKGQRASFEEAIGRVSAIARVHEQLYRSGETRWVEAAGYLSALCRELEHSASASSEPWRIVMAGEPTLVSPDEAVKLGLALNELVTNAFKHGRPAGPGQDYRIDARLTRTGLTRKRLVVRDYGPGPSADADPSKTGGLGFSLIHSIAMELDGNLTVGNAEPGTCVTLDFETGPGDPIYAMTGAQATRP